MQYITKRWSVRRTIYRFWILHTIYRSSHTHYIYIYIYIYKTLDNEELGTRVTSQHFIRFRYVQFHHFVYRLQMDVVCMMPLILCCHRWLWARCLHIIKASFELLSVQYWRYQRFWTAKIDNRSLTTNIVAWRFFSFTVLLTCTNNRFYGFCVLLGVETVC